MTYGVQKANGSVSGGEFLTSNLQFFTFWTMVPMAATGVRLPLADALKILDIANFAGESFNGVTYANDAAYTNALAKQANLDLLVKVFAQRANPVIVSVSSASIDDGVPVGDLHAGASNATKYGSSYNGGQTEYTVKIVTERSPAWNVDATAESNTNGYQILTALQGLAVSDISTNVLVTNVFETSASSNDRNILAIKSETL